MNIIDNEKQIKKAYLVFVIVHGSPEYYNLPSPRMQKQYRFYAEQGADIVVGHHTHCISGNETHKGVPIYYSLGNFLSTSQSSIKDWYLGLVLEVEIKEGKLSTLLHSTKQEEKTFELSLLQNEEKEEILNRIIKYNKVIKDSIKLKHEWENYITDKFPFT